MPNPIEVLKNKYETIIEYADRELSTFHELPFHEVDSLIFAELSYLDFTNIFQNPEETEDIFLQDLYKKELFPSLFQYTVFTNKDKTLFEKLCASPRYRDVKIKYFSNKYDVDTQEQFAAVTFQLPDHSHILSYRGTDIGMIGWQEDFNMLYLSPVPSQVSAVRYLREVSGKTSGPLTLVGHSKGGNLAVYAGLFSGLTVEKRISNIYNLDGPGFQNDVLEVMENSSIRSKIIKIMPEGSFIGVILNTVEETKWIKCNKIGFMQHEAHSWLSENGKFITSKGVTHRVRHMDQSFHALVNELSVQQRKEAIDTIFTILQEINAEKLSDLAPQLLKEKDTIKTALGELDPQTADCIKECFRQFMKASFASVIGKKEGDKQKNTLF